MKTLFPIIVLLMAACSPKVDLVEQGKKLFNQTHIGKNNVLGCVACHSIQPSQVIIGPSLAGLSIRAPHLVPNQSAQDYIRNAIINPDAYIVEGFLPAVMFSHYQQELSENEVHALVLYLSQL